MKDDKTIELFRNFIRTEHLTAKWEAYLDTNTNTNNCDYCNGTGVNQNAIELSEKKIARNGILPMDAPEIPTFTKLSSLETDKKFNDIRKNLEESANYSLKTNEELIHMICNFGHGELEFDTPDIERLIKENEYLMKQLN